MKGDNIIALNDIQTPAFFDFSKQVKQYKNKQVQLTFIRNGEQKTVSLIVNALGQIGVGITPPEKLFVLHTTTYSFWQSIPAGIAKGFETLESYVRQLKLIFTAEGAKQIGGFGAIGSLFPTTWDWEIFWGMTAFLSIVLAFMNFLPIPALDGGHIMFLVYEFITGKKPGDKFLEKAQIIGMGLLLTLLLYANLNDVFRFFVK
jgi:regulator of sigma E protease